MYYSRSWIENCCRITGALWTTNLFFTSRRVDINRDNVKLLTRLLAAWCRPYLGDLRITVITHSSDADYSPVIHIDRCEDRFYPTLRGVFVSLVTSTIIRSSWGCIKLRSSLLMQSTRCTGRSIDHSTTVICPARAASPHFSPQFLFLGGSTSNVLR